VSDPDPLSPITLWLTEATEERKRVSAQLATAKGVAAEKLAVALRDLDEKIATAQAKRAELEGRVGRALRVRAITEELGRITAAVQAEVAANGESPHAQELKREAEALAAEGRALIGQMPPAKRE